MENASNPVVGFFDSGIGGLWLLHDCVKKLPNVDFVYFSDNKNVPYGSLPQDVLCRKADYIFDEIAALSPAAAVVACNTVTARCIDHLRQKYPFKIVGIQPAIKPAAAVGGTCLVLSTPATANSEHIKELVKNYGNGNVRVVPCPNLAQYIEENYENLDENYIKKALPDIKCDSVVLGCTHYIYIKNIVKSLYNCPVFDGIEGTSNRLLNILGKNDHRARGQSVNFRGGFEDKNRDIFKRLVLELGLKYPQN